MNLWENSCKESVELFLMTSSWLLLTHLKWQGINRDHKDRMVECLICHLSVHVLSMSQTFHHWGGKKRSKIPELSPQLPGRIFFQSTQPFKNRRPNLAACCRTSWRKQIEAFSDGGFLITAEATTESLKAFQFEPFPIISVNKHMKLLKRVDFLCYIWLWGGDRDILFCCNVFCWKYGSKVNLQWTHLCLSEGVCTRGFTSTAVRTRFQEGAKEMARCRECKFLSSALIVSVAWQRASEGGKRALTKLLLQSSTFFSLLSSSPCTAALILFSLPACLRWDRFCRLRE